MAGPFLPGRIGGLQSRDARALANPPNTALPYVVQATALSQNDFQTATQATSFFPSPVTKGNAIILCVVCSSSAGFLNPTVTDTLGNAWVTLNAAAANQPLAARTFLAICPSIAASGATRVILGTTGANRFLAVFAIEVSGLSPTITPDSFAILTSPSIAANTGFTQAIAPSDPNAFVLSLWGSTGGSAPSRITGHGIPSGFTDLLTFSQFTPGGNEVTLCAAWGIGAAASSIKWNWTTTTASNVGAVLIAFRSAGAASLGRDLTPRGPQSRQIFLTAPGDTSQPMSGSSAVGVAAITEASDMASGTGTDESDGSAAVAESSDVATGIGTDSVFGAAAIPESADIAAGAGTVAVSATAAIPEGADVASGTGTDAVAGIAAITEGADTAGSVGLSNVVGVAAIIESADTDAGTGIDGVTGLAAVLEGADTAAGAGTASSAVTGSAAISEDPDVVASVASVTGVAVADAGGRRTIFIYRLVWNGKTHHFGTYEDAVEFLQKAKEKARRSAIHAANRAVRLQRKTSVPLPLPQSSLPEIVAVESLASIAKKARDEIRVIYEQERVNGEIRLLMELNKRKSDDDESLFWLM